MTSVNYIIRLDDACPTMLHKNWSAFEKILDEFQVKPIIAVIPDNHDPKMMISEFDPNFWARVRQWQKKGWVIALHGYRHEYVSTNSGIIKINNKTEFAGLRFSEQDYKIRSGLSIFKKNGVQADCWVAPSHTFDYETVNALKKNGIKVISDGLAIYPYNDDGVMWIPQQLWGFKHKKLGVWTSCFHPNSMSIEEINELRSFISQNQDKFITIDYHFLSRFERRKRDFFDSVFQRFFYVKLAILRTYIGSLIAAYVVNMKRK